MQKRLQRLCWTAWAWAWAKSIMFNIKSCEVGVELNCCTALISQDLNLIRSWVLITFICPLWSRLIVIFSLHREKRAGNSSSSFSQTCFIAARGQRLVKNWSGSIERWKLLLQIWSGLRKKSGIDIKISWRWKLLYSSLLHSDLVWTRCEKPF